MSRRVLVTGRSGFVGGKLADRLSALGWSVTGIGRRQLDQPNYLSHDLGNPLPRELEGRFDAVVHAAARSNPWGKRTQYERDNVKATQNVIDFCNRNGKPKLIYISSSSVYYRSQHQLDITEQTPLPAKSVNLYAETKRKGEELIRNYQAPWAILRPRAVFGPGDTVLLPRIVEAAKQGKLPLLVAPGESIIGDLIYIDNLTDYIIKAVEDDKIQGDYNLTNNEPVPIIDFLMDVLGKLEIPLPTRRVSVRTAMFGAAVLEGFHKIFRPSREPAITRFGVHVFAYSKTFDVSKSIRDMGTPKINIEQGIKQTILAMKSDDPEKISGTSPGSHL